MSHFNGHLLLLSRFSGTNSLNCLFKKPTSKGFLQLGRFIKKVKVDASINNIEEPRTVAQEIKEAPKTFIYL